MKGFVSSEMSSIIAFVLAGLYITALAIDMKREEKEEK